MLEELEVEVLDEVLDEVLVEVLDEVLLEAELVELLDVVVVFTVPLPAAPAQAPVGVQRQAATMLAVRSFVKFIVALSSSWNRCSSDVKVSCRAAHGNR